MEHQASKSCLVGKCDSNVPRIGQSKYAQCANIDDGRSEFRIDVIKADLPRVTQNLLQSHALHYYMPCFVKLSRGFSLSKE